ncbi:MAG: DNA-directed RNA polymerase subunit beta' [Negativicutes bacterium]
MQDVNTFDSMRIGLASPEQITSWSHGEVKKPETINYRTLKPERDGLFCEKIFGPTRDWECHCGKYKRIRHKGVVCDRCGVEVTKSKVRRDRMGHIDLAAPVSHIWYFKGIPSRMGLILDISPRALEKVLYFASYIVLDPKDTPLMRRQLLTEKEYRDYYEKYGSHFEVGMGAEAIKKLLEELDLEKMSRELRQELKEVSGQRRIRAIRRLEVVEAFRKSGNKPQWMIMDVVPVIPPELRPMVQLDGGRFATSDLNDLYRRVINRNNRLKRLLELKAPDIIVRNEKRMLQEAVDALIDNGRRGRPVTGPGNRPLKSLSDMLKGKQGRFRQNLLGKRVDYSGRSVIVVGPELKLHQCGLPKEMALELFKPFVMKKLVNAGHAHNIKSAKRMVERMRPEVWDVLEEVIREHPVLLNRAPTLHRLGIQAFEPVLSEGRAIKIHPLVCTAYNADFDGDQMAVHVPLSAEAQSEARVLMLSAHNILSTKDGRPVASPTQDMVLGSYYLTIERESAANEKSRSEGLPLHAYSGGDEALQAYHFAFITLHEKIRIRIPGHGLITTTMGRFIFNEALPEELKQYSADGKELGKLMDKKELGKLIADCYRRFGNAQTADVLDKIKKLGFTYATRAGITIAVSDIKIPKQKKVIIAATDAQVEKINSHYRNGLLTGDERYIKVVDLWKKATDDVTDSLMKSLDRLNPVYMMATSGARGNIQQIRQLAGMRGLMSDPSGRIIDLPIKANFREGLTVLEYFISTHGARKGLADTALRTADSGYLTRRLVDVAQDLIVREDDCDVLKFSIAREVDAMRVTHEQSISRAKMALIGKSLTVDAVSSATGEIVLPAGTVLETTGIDRLLMEQVLEINVPELISLTLSRQQMRNNLRDLMLREMLNRSLEEDVVDPAGASILVAGTQLQEEHIEILLDSDVFGDINVRRNSVKGIDAEAIVEEAIKEPLTKVISLKTADLRNRAVQQTSGEEIQNPKTRKVIVNKGEVLTLEKIAEISSIRDEIRVLNMDLIGKKSAELVLDESGNSLVQVGDLLDENNKKNITTLWRLRGDAGTFTICSNVIEKLRDRIVGRSAAEDIADPKTGEMIVRLNEEISEDVVDRVAAVRSRVLIRSVLTCKCKYGVCVKCYARNLATGRIVDVGEAVGIIAAQSIGEPGTQLTMRTFHTGGVASTGGQASGGDITSGLPRVEELFEARKPKHPAVLTEIDGRVELREAKGARRAVVTSSSGEERIYPIPYGSRILVREAQLVEPGDRLTDGPLNPHDILRIRGLRDTHRYIVSEVQKVYKEQGVEINDKHIEVMVRQMLHKVKVEEPGDTEFLPGEYIDINSFEAENLKALEQDGEPAVARPILLGITKASLATDSFLSAASFQETTRVLTDAAIKGKVDPLLGLKENVIIGKLIPAGTGMARYRNINLKRMKSSNQPSEA